MRCAAACRQDIKGSKEQVNKQKVFSELLLDGLKEEVEIDQIKAFFIGAEMAF